MQVPSSPTAMQQAQAATLEICNIWLHPAATRRAVAAHSGALAGASCLLLVERRELAGDSQILKYSAPQLQGTFLIGT
jgi:hypothetical protein